MGLPFELLLPAGIPGRPEIPKNQFLFDFTRNLYQQKKPSTSQNFPIQTKNFPLY